MRAHQAALQAIADANGGNRFAGLSGHDESVDYVVDKLEAAGWDVGLQAFDYTAVPRSSAPRRCSRPRRDAVTYVEDVDFGVIDQSDPGDVTAAVTGVDLQFGLGNTSTSGCETADFAGFPAGNIALLQRGVCTFELKAENAAAAGAVGIVIFNQGNTPDRTGIPPVTLTANNTSGIPVLGTTYALGDTLAHTAGLRMRVFANTERKILPTANVIAERTGTNDDNVVMAGAHLDSVLDGPGHQRQRLGQRRPPRGRRAARPREAAEHGSPRVVDRRGERARRLDELRQQPERRGAGSDRALPELRHGRLAELHLHDAGRRPVELRRLRSPFRTARSRSRISSSPSTRCRDEPYDDAAFDGRSDYQAFILNDIPAGGLFTGAEVPKTAEQQAIWGGTVGAQFDPCYHQACDTFANNNDHALDVNADPIGFALLTYAYSTESVNGVPGKRVPGQGTSQLPAPAGSQGTFIP